MYVNIQPYSVAVWTVLLTLQIEKWTTIQTLVTPTASGQKIDCKLAQNVQIITWSKVGGTSCLQQRELSLA